jgi:hypothetical protein
VIRDAWCSCGRPGAVLADAGTGLVGWRHLAPFCTRCAAGRPALSLPEFVARLGATVLIDQPTAGAGLAPIGADLSGPGAGTGTAADAAAGWTDPADSPIAVLNAEIALLHARLDDLQSRMGH